MIKIISRNEITINKLTIEINHTDHVFSLFQTHVHAQRVQGGLYFLHCHLKLVRSFFHSILKAGTALVTRFAVVKLMHVFGYIESSMKKIPN